MTHLLHLPSGSIVDYQGYKQIKIVDAHASQIKPGDTIIDRRGNMQTICRRCIAFSTFCDAWLINGDSYKGGRVPVKKVLFPRDYAQ